jgi:hypothetical protein
MDTTAHAYLYAGVRMIGDLRRVLAGEENMDWLRLVVWVGSCALIIATTSAGILVYQNLASKTVVLAGSAFLGAMMIFGINLWTELRSVTIRDRLSVEYTLDRKDTTIRTWRYPVHNPTWRFGVERDASAWLAGHRPEAFLIDGERLALDLALFSLIGFITRKEFDWQLRETTFIGDVAGTMTVFGRASKPGECVEVRPEELTRLLTSADNVFAGTPLFVVGGAVCLPPGGILQVAARTVTLRTRICQVSFTVEPSGGVGYIVPESGDTESLEDGKSRYETRVVGFAVEITRFALRAHHWDAEKHMAWCQRLVTSAREWFRHALPSKPPFR